MIQIEEVTVLNDIVQRLRQVTPEMIAGVERKHLTEELRPGDTQVGVITSEATRSLFALWHSLVAESKLEMAKKEVADDEQIARDHEERYMIADSLGDVARNMFWAQARIETGFLKPATVGVRRGWVLCEMKSPDTGKALLQMLTGLG